MRVPLGAWAVAGGVGAGAGIAMLHDDGPPQLQPQAFAVSTEVAVTKLAAIAMAMSLNITNLLKNIGLTGEPEFRRTDSPEFWID